MQIRKIGLKETLKTCQETVRAKTQTQTCLTSLHHSEKPEKSKLKDDREGEHQLAESEAELVRGPACNAFHVGVQTALTNESSAPPTSSLSDPFPPRLRMDVRQHSYTVTPGIIINVWDFIAALLKLKVCPD